MKFGVQASQSQMAWPDLLSLWQDLDRSSTFDSLWLMDHFVTGTGQAFGAEGPCLEGWTALAALAQATSRVRLGIIVSGNTYRHPVVLAKQATTVDHISNGRLEFGIGGAWHVYEHQAYGIPFYTTGERLKRLDEAVQLIKLLWTEDSPTFEGDYYGLDEPPYNPSNVQKPHPPIMIGGGGEKRTLLTAAKYGDASNVQGTPEEVAHKWDVLSSHCESVGRDFNTIRRTIQTVLFLTEDPAFQERVIQGVKSLRGASSDEEARKSVLMGSPEQVVDQIKAFEAVGVQEIVLAQFPSVHQKSLMRFSEEVIPAFR
ncbi:MAG: TIGR03560 family F420-dependent LLM class oxidoreductase [Chloroflexi bacterium]|nr:TIGR03560 family F420-dependent LLM class oxidoreductase [Chloroflexota bacterium]